MAGFFISRLTRARELAELAGPARVYNLFRPIGGPAAGR